MSAVENLITDNLPIWSSSVQLKSSSGRGASSKRKLYGVKKLRGLILDLAIRGLLVTQEENDESVVEIIEKGRSERLDLVRKGVIRSQKQLPPLNREATPFEVPKGWAWQRLPDVTFFQEGPGIMAKDFRTAGIPLIRISGMANEMVSLDGCNYLDEKMVDTKWSHFKLDLGDIVLTSSASLGKVSKVGEEAKGCIAYTGLIRFKPFASLSENYLMKFFDSNEFVRQIDARKTGAAIKHFGPTHLKLMVIPIPPLAEQYRIVAKVDELMALCDILEQKQEDSIQAHEALVEALLEALTSAADADAFQAAWQRISEHFDVLFTTEHSIEKLKETILQLAVMGKLVPQDPSDEPASELLKNIVAKKEQLVKEKLIKKQKPLTEITGEEKPFNLPRGWVWTTLSNLGTFFGGKTPSKNNSRYWGGSIPWVTPKDMKVNDIFGAQDKVTQLAIDDGLGLVDCESLLFVARSGILRRAFPVAITRVECTVNQDLKVLSLFDKKLSRYVHLMMKGFEGYILNNLTKIGTTVESLKFDEFSRHYFLLPPLAEQHRIVAKVDQLMALCDQLKDSLQQAQQTQIHLTDAVVENAL